MRIMLSATLSTLILSSCMSGPDTQGDWRAVTMTDQFTDVSARRVERGTPSRRSILRRVNRTFFSAEFIIENMDGTIRLGAIMEPTAPISGDLQIRVDDDPAWKITLSDTPVDVAPTMPSFGSGAHLPQADATMSQVYKHTAKMVSPFRMAQGEKARRILNQILNGRSVKYRLLGVNAAMSSTGQFDVDAAFRQAIVECGLAEHGA